MFTGSLDVHGSDPNSFVTIGDIAAWAYGTGELPEEVEGGLAAQVHYDPASLTYPNGAYICVVDVDPGTAVVTVRRFVEISRCSRASRGSTA